LPFLFPSDLLIGYTRFLQITIMQHDEVFVIDVEVFINDSDTWVLLQINVSQFLEFLSQIVDLVADTLFFKLSHLQTMVLFCSEFGLLNTVLRSIRNVPCVFWNASQGDCEYRFVNTIDSWIYFRNIGLIFFLKGCDLLVCDFQYLLLGHVVHSFDSGQWVEIRLLQNHVLINHIRKYDAVLAS